MTHKLLTSLLLKAARIQQRIDAEHKTPSRNWVHLMRLKKLRLKITEKIYLVAKQFDPQMLKSVPVKSKYKNY